MAKRRALLVANRRSLAGATDLSDGLDRLERAGIELRRHSVDDPLSIPEIIRNEGPDVDLMVIGGGDGTMNIAADALVELGKPVGIIPIGTANDLARTLQIPTTVPEACAVIAAGHTRAVDLGRANGKHFFNVASIGLAAEVTRHHQGARKKWLRVLSYPLSVWDAFKTTRPFRAWLRCDEQELRIRAIQITVGNGRHYGGGMTIAEDAAIDDQHLDVYCLKPLSFWGLLILFPALRLGRLKDREPILVTRGREVEVRTRRRLRVNTDGELTTRTPVLFDIAAHALDVFAPRVGSGEGTR
ncbi:MAG: lipid kinase [Geminicoccaceae bacterium]|nr:lipid kinase [Geminicoccaceae bacterium]